MTLINAWWHDLDGTGEDRERRVFVQCDGCLPPRVLPGSAESLARAGWRFDRLEVGPHYCPWCRPMWRRGKRRRLFFPEKRPALPNLVTIGAPKCGTTSLHRYLSLHPEVHMSRAKEVNFFQDPGCLDGLDTYATHFSADAPVRGESSTVYTWYPLTMGIPQRISAALPDVKLIYLVRDPVDRVVSQYAQRASARFTPVSLEDVVRETDDPYNTLIAISRYATQLEQYAQILPMDRILVIDQADLLERREETLRRVFRFVGVDEGFSSPEFARLANTRAAKRYKTAVYRALSRSSLAAGIRRRFPSSARQAVFRPAKRLTTREFEPPELTDVMRRRLYEVFRPEVERLREMTGQDFPTWRI